MCCDLVSKFRVRFSQWFGFFRSRNGRYSCSITINFLPDSFFSTNNRTPSYCFNTPPLLLLELKVRQVMFTSGGRSEASRFSINSKTCLKKMCSAIVQNSLLIYSSKRTLKKGPILPRQSQKIPHTKSLNQLVRPSLELKNSQICLRRAACPYFESTLSHFIFCHI